METIYRDVGEYAYVGNMLLLLERSPSPLLTGGEVSWAILDRSEVRVRGRGGSRDKALAERRRTEKKETEESRGFVRE